MSQTSSQICRFDSSDTVAKVLTNIKYEYIKTGTAL